MAVRAGDLSYFKALLERYKQCPVPSLSEISTLAIAKEIFAQISAIDRSVLLTHLPESDDLMETLRVIDGSQHHTRTFLPVLDAATLIVNNSIEPVSTKKASELANELLSLGIESEQDLGWKGFYESVVEGLCQLALPGTSSQEELDSDSGAVDERTLESEVRIAAELQEAIADGPGQLATAQEEGASNAAERLELVVNEQEVYRSAHQAYFEQRNYERVLQVLEHSCSFDAICLRARALTKLRRFQEAHEAFDLGFQKAENAEQTHLILHRKAVAHLEKHKTTKEPASIEGCVAALLASLRHGKSFYMAKVTWDLFQMAGRKDWEELISKKYKVHHLMWHSAALLLQNPQAIDDGYKLMRTFPMGLAAKYLGGEVSLRSLIQEERIDLPLAILSGWHVLKKKPGEWSCLPDGFRKLVYEHLTRAAEILLREGHFFLATQCAKNAWVEGHMVGFAVESSLLFASALVHAGDFEQLAHWVTSAGSFAGREKAILLSDLLWAFRDHHDIGKAKILSSSSGAGRKTYVVTRESVKSNFERARPLFPIAAKEPYWHSILKHYFPGENFS